MNCVICNKPLLYAQVPEGFRTLFKDAHIKCSFNEIQKMMDSPKSRKVSTAQQNKEITKQKICEGNQPPKGFKEGICKCGDLYMGSDFGSCIKCIDKMERKTNSQESLNIEKLDEMPDYETMNRVVVRDTRIPSNDKHSLIHPDSLLKYNIIIKTLKEFSLNYKNQYPKSIPDINLILNVIEEELEYNRIKKFVHEIMEDY